MRRPHALASFQASFDLQKKSIRKKPSFTFNLSYALWRQDKTGDMHESITGPVRVTTCQVVIYSSARLLSGV
jgi:hypothetical protein